MSDGATAAADVETKTATASDGCAGIEEILARIQEGGISSATKRELAKLSDSCFQTRASDFDYANRHQGHKQRPFQLACSETTGAQSLRKKIDDGNLHNVYVPGDSHAESTDKVTHFDVIHYPTKSCVEYGNLYLNPKNGLPGQRSMNALGRLKTIILVLVYGLHPKEA